MTLPEVLIWRRVRNHGFRRQHALAFYILDFYRPKDRLCIEIDGQGHDLAHDARRDAFLLERNIRTIRIPASSILRDLDAVTDYILSL